MNKISTKESVKNIIEFIELNNLRKILINLILIFITLFLITQTFLTYKKFTNFENSNFGYISSYGKAEEYIIPDTLTFNVNISEEGKDISEATLKAAEKNKKAINILIANGVDKENIKLENYNIMDKYENVSEPCTYSAEQNIKTTISTNVNTVSSASPVSSIAPCQVSNSKIVGQILNQTMSVKIRDIEKNANNEKRTKIIAELAKENIKVDGFNFTVYDMESVQKKIREKAIKNAKEDARKLSKDLNIKLGKLSNFSEENNPISPMFSANPVESMMNVRSLKSDTVSNAPELTPGQQKITSNVTLTYFIK